MPQKAAHEAHSAQIGEAGASGGSAARCGLTASSGLVQPAAPSAAMLAPGTRVRVVGNNRTKAALVGLQGMVQKAVGLGGWHHILTEDGSSVRVQRNALSLVGALPAPTPVLLAAKPATLGAMALSADMRALEAHADKPRPRGRGRGASKRVAAARGGGLPPSGPRSRVAKKAPLSTPAAGGLSADSVVGTSSSATSLNFAALRLEALRRYRRAFRITDAAMGAGTGTDQKCQLVEMVRKHFVTAEHQIPGEAALLRAFIAVMGRQVAA